MTQSSAPINQQNSKKPNRRISKMVIFIGFLRAFVKWSAVILLLLFVLLVIGFYQFGNSALQNKIVQKQLKNKIATAFKTNVENVQFNNLQLQWSGLSPHVQFQDFSVKNQGKEPLISVKKADIDFGRIDLGIENAVIDGLKIHIYNRPKGLEIAGFISDNSPTPPWFKWINKNKLRNASALVHLKPLRTSNVLTQTPQKNQTPQNFTIHFDSSLNFANKKQPLNVQIRNVIWQENPNFIAIKAHKPILFSAQPNFQNDKSLDKNIELLIDSVAIGTSQDKTIVNEKIKISQIKNNQLIENDTHIENFFKQKSFTFSGVVEAEKSWANAMIKNLNIQNQQGDFKLKKGNCSLQHCLLQGIELAPLNDLLLQTTQQINSYYPDVNHYLTAYLPEPQFHTLTQFKQSKPFQNFEKQRALLVKNLAQWQKITNISGVVDELQWHQELGASKKQGLKLKISQLGARFQQKNSVFLIPQLQARADIKNEKLVFATAQFQKGFIDFSGLQEVFPLLKQKLDIQGTLDNIHGNFNIKSVGGNFEIFENHWNIQGQGKNIIVKLSDKIPLLTGNPSLKLHDKSLQLIATPLVLKSKNTENSKNNVITELASVKLNLTPHLMAIKLAPTTLKWNNNVEFVEFYERLQAYLPVLSPQMTTLKSLNVLGEYTISGQMQKPNQGNINYDAQLQIKNGAMSIPNYPHLTAVQGIVNLKHQVQRGLINHLEIENLKMVVGGQKINIHGSPNAISAKHHHVNDNMTIVGAVNIDELITKYPHFSPLKPLELLAKGIIDFEVTVNPQKINVYSHLTDAQVLLPEPLQKLEKGLEAPFYLSYNRINPHLLVQWKDRLHAELVLQQKEKAVTNLLKYGTLTLGEGTNINTTEKITENANFLKGLNVFANLQNLNLDVWKGFLTRLKNTLDTTDKKELENEVATKLTAKLSILEQEKQERKEKLLNSWLPKNMELSVKELQFDERKLHDVMLSIRATDSIKEVGQIDTLWNMDISSNDIKGNANWQQHHRLSNRADKVKAHFTEMTIPPKDLSLLKTLLGYEVEKSKNNENNQSTENIQSIQIPEIDLTIDHLKYHEQALGKAVLKTEIDPLNPEYVLLDELSLTGAVLNTKIAGYFPNQLKNNQKRNSLVFNEKENVGLQWTLDVPKLELLSTLIPSELIKNQPELKNIFNSGSMNASGNVGWKGQLFTEPLLIAQSLEGYVKANAQKVRVIPLDLGWGKGLSLFNPKTWARFTVLNFSDLMDKGYLIDEAKLSGTFANKQLQITGNNFMDSSLAKVKATGMIHWDSNPMLNTDMTLNIEPKIVTGIGATTLSFFINPLIGLGLIGGDYAADFPIQRWLSFDYRLNNIAKKN